MKRIDYDAVAPTYDNNPYRCKTVDPHLVEFLQEREHATLQVLDLACGTGNQMIANHNAYPTLHMTGCDLSEGMLNEARLKRPDLNWVQGSLTELPFEDGFGHFVSCQYAFHHVEDKLKGISELARVTARQGRLVMQNIHPHMMSENLLFKYFPKSYEQDLVDFMHPEDIADAFRVQGFDQVILDTETLEFEVSLGQFMESVSDKTSNSELALLSQDEYQLGLDGIQAEISEYGPNLIKHNVVVLMTIVADYL